MLLVGLLFGGWCGVWGVLILRQPAGSPEAPGFLPHVVFPWAGLGLSTSLATMHDLRTKPLKAPKKTLRSPLKTPQKPFKEPVKKPFKQPFKNPLKKPQKRKRTLNFQEVLEKAKADAAALDEAEAFYRPEDTAT